MTLRFLSRIAASVLIGALLMACVPQAPQGVVQVGEALLPDATATPQVIFVTPTSQPSAVPTTRLITPSVTPSPTITPSPTPDAAALVAQCDTVLDALYTEAGSLCLGQPSGYLCNGSLPPQAVIPQGAAARSLSAPGALIEADAIQSVRGAPLMHNNSGGLMWLHLEENIKLNALMIGDVELTDVTPADANLPAWQAFTVRTHHHDTGCDRVPYSTLIVQGQYGQTSRMAINGVSIALNGSLAVQTHDQRAVFAVIEGRAEMATPGVRVALVAGEQFEADYPDDNLLLPQARMFQAEPLDFALIHDLPVMLMDRPVLLPQPGYARTEALVNMRAEPSLDGQLLYQVPADETLSILGQNEAQDWFHIRLGNGETGWMKADLLTQRIGDIAQIYNQTPVPPQRLGDLAERAVVNVQFGSNLRTAPDAAFPVMDTLPFGSEVRLLARSPYSAWVKVDTGERIGWMALFTLETQSAIGFLPVDYDVPFPPRPTAEPVFDFGGGHAYPDPLGGS